VVDQEDEAAKEAAFQKSTQVKKFEIIPEIVHDWTGQKFLTTHRCFGGPCKGDPALLALENQELNLENEA